MLMHFVALVDRQFNQKIKCVRWDNVIEFNCPKIYFVQQGIIFGTHVLKLHNRMIGLNENINIF